MSLPSISHILYMSIFVPKTLICDNLYSDILFGSVNASFQSAHRVRKGTPDLDTEGIVQWNFTFYYFEILQY